MSNNHNDKIALTFEILGAFVPLASQDEIDQTAQNLNIDVNFVSNSNNEVNLTLPFYSDLEEVVARALNEQEAKDVAGGEFIIASIVSLVAVVGGTAALAGGVASAVIRDDPNK